MATYYINADTGDDTTGDGSQGNPWLTFNYAADQTDNGDTIFCQNASNTYLYVNKNLNEITVTGESVNGVVFAGDGVSLTTGWQNTGGDLIVQNITFTSLIASATNHRCFTAKSSKTFYLRNCIVHNIQGGATRTRGIFSNWGIGTFEVQSCIVYDFNNDVTDRNGYSGAKFNLLNNVVHYEPGTSGQFFGGQDGTTLYTVKNNILYNTTGANVDLIRYSIPPPVFDNNLLFGVFSDIPSGNNNLIDVDPLFVDPSTRNYNLSPSSPCIDAGTLI
jgi:hypothetical protein